MYSDIISSALERFHRYLGQNLPFCRDHRAARVSAFWTEHFSDRRNFPEVHDFMSFRRGDFLYGIGDTKPSSSEQKQREFDEIVRSISLVAPPAFIAGLREPYLGAPQVFRHGESWQSGSFVLNAGTTWRVRELLSQHGPQGRALHACEIGAGWGACALQLHQATDVSSYTIIDLPENLCLSSTYLSATLPDKVAHFLACGPEAGSPGTAPGLYFGLPPAIDHLPGPYDLMLNTVSLQEMDRDTVMAYLDWAARSLAPDGVLVSFNSHDKEGVRRPSEYLTAPLRLLHLQPFRKLPAGFFNTIPYEMVFKRAEGAGQNVAVGVDAIGEMIQLGLDSQLVPYTAALLSGGASADLMYLDLVRRFFYAEDEDVRRQVADQMLASRPDAVTGYLVGNWQFATGDLAGAQSSLAQSLASGLEDFAALRALVMLSLLTTPDWARLQATSGGLFGEIKKIIEEKNVSALQNHIARVMDCPVVTPSVPGGLLQKARTRLARLK